MLICDIDVIGDGELSLLNDVEMPVIIERIFTAMDIGEFVISVNNRKILTGFLACIGFDESNVGRAIKIVDNQDKVGIEQTRNELKGLGADEEAVDQILGFFQMDGSVDEILNALSEQNYNDTYDTGVAELKAVVGMMRGLGMPEHRFKVDVSIAEDWITTRVRFMKLALWSAREKGSLLVLSSVIVKRLNIYFHGSMIPSGLIGANAGIF